jgi:hypothetical protein
MILPDLFAVLTLAPHLRAVSLPNDGGLALVGECQQFRLPAGEVSRVVQALDGATDVDGVLASATCWRRACFVKRPLASRARRPLPLG